MMKLGLGFILIVGLLIVAFSFVSPERSQVVAQPVDTKGLEHVTLAAGWFWGVEAGLQKIRGVKSTTVGYTGGADSSPTYGKVCTGKTGHAEAVDVFFDPKVISYSEILKKFFRLHRPFYDAAKMKGGQYRSAIFYHNIKEEKLAKEAKAAAEKSYGRKLYTEIKPAKVFFRAEDYHQNYYNKRGR